MIERNEKVTGIDPSVFAEPRPIRSAAVIGAGAIGGMAMVFANAGNPVTPAEIDQEALAKNLATVRRNYGTSVSRGSMTQAKVDRALAFISTAIDYEDFAQANIVIEAVLEKMDLKESIFVRLHAVMKSGAIFATNTSSLDLDEIAAAPGAPTACRWADLDAGHERPRRQRANARGADPVPGRGRMAVADP